MFNDFFKSSISIPLDAVIMLFLISNLISLNFKSKFCDLIIAFPFDASSCSKFLTYLKFSAIISILLFSETAFPSFAKTRLPLS